MAPGRPGELRRAELRCRPSASGSRSRRHHVENGWRAPSGPRRSIALEVGWSGAGKRSAQNRQCLLETSVAGEAECLHRVDLRKCVHRSRSFVEWIAAKRERCPSLRKGWTEASVRAFRADETRGSDDAVAQRRLHRGSGLQSSQHVNGGNGFARQFRRDVRGNDGEPEDLNMKCLAGRSDGLQVLPAVAGADQGRAGVSPRTASPHRRDGRADCGSPSG